jgi:GNAT superfamily N-acetyltransferase
MGSSSQSSVEAAVERRIEHTAARHAVEFAEQLRATEPDWRTESFPLAGGHVVLSGRGLFVNRGLAVGLDRPVSDDDLDQLERRSRSIGVMPTLEVSPGAEPSVRAACDRRGYVVVSTTSVLVLGLPHVLMAPGSTEVRVTEIGAGKLAVWQELAAQGWSHVAPDRRRASDAWAAAAFRVEGEVFFIARDVDDRRPLGCASLTIRDGLAVLGGMSTLPGERGRGVQSALVRERLALAAARGCDLATATVAPGSASERNLVRLGFTPVYENVILQAA